jgi:gamma-glutamyl-gamma-aminobutyrate hydrolase PuuD
VIHSFFKYKILTKKSKRTIDKIYNSQQQASRPPAIIPFRRDGNGKGAYHDHYTIQLMTGDKTVMSISDEQRDATTILSEYLRTMTYDLKFGETDDKTSKKIPKIIDNATEKTGLLIITGVSRKIFESEIEYERRRKHNYALIKEAYRRGQPVLGICGGAWELWEAKLEEPKTEEESLKSRLLIEKRINSYEKSLALFEKMENTFNRKFIEITALKKLLSRASELIFGFAIEAVRFGKIRSVDDHNYRGGMPQIKESTGKVGHNKQMHKIKLKDDAYLLKASMTIKQKEGFVVNDSIPVNSVHSHAVDEKFIPPWFTISATTVQDDALAPLSVDGTKRLLKPEEDSVEAFESAYGAPWLGIQWHLEAYTSNTDPKYFPDIHRNILKYMMQSGQVYQQRQEIVQEIKSKIDSLNLPENDSREAEVKAAKFQERILKNKTGLLSYSYVINMKVKNNDSNRSDYQIDIKNEFKFKKAGDYPYHQFKPHNAKYPKLQHLDETLNEITSKRIWLEEQNFSVSMSGLKANRIKKPRR